MQSRRRRLSSVVLTASVITGVVPAVGPALGADPAAASVPLDVAGRELACASVGGCAFELTVGSDTDEPVIVVLEPNATGLLASPVALSVAPGAGLLTLAVRQSSDVVAGESAEVVATCSAAIDVPAAAVRLDVAFVATDHACVLDPAPVTDPAAPAVTEAAILTLQPLPTSVDRWSRPGDNRIAPSSIAGVGIGVRFPLTLGHCVLLSPVDVDGALWDPVGGVDADGGTIDDEDELNELWNETSMEAILVHRDRLDLRTPLGSVIVLSRHVGAGAYPGCD